MMTGTSSSFHGRNYSDEERRRILAEFQHETTIIMAPSIVFLCLLFVTGLVGNSLVLFVYSRRFSRSPLRTYVKAAAVVDLLSNLIVIPGDISDIFNWWDYDLPYLCKARRLVNTSISLWSAVLLLSLAVARYRKVCRPFSRQVNMSHVKISMIGVIGLPIIFSVPYALLHGRQSRMTPHPGVYGYFCSVDASYVQTKWPMINACFFLLLFLASCIPLVVLYALIGAKAWRHKRNRMEAVRLKISGSTDAIKTNTDDNSTSVKLDTLGQAKCDSNDQMIICGFKSRLQECDSTTKDNNTKEEKIPGTGERMRMPEAETLRNDLEASCTRDDRDKYVKRKYQSLQRNVDGKEFGAFRRCYSGGKEMHSSHKTHTVDNINSDIHKHDVTNPEALKEDVIEPVRPNFDIKFPIRKFEMTAKGDDHLTGNLGTFKPIDSSSQHLEAPPNIEFLKYELRPNGEHSTPLSTTPSDRGAALLGDTPSSSLQRKHCVAFDLPQPRNDPNQLGEGNWRQTPKRVGTVGVSWRNLPRTGTPGEPLFVAYAPDGTTGHDDDEPRNAGHVSHKTSHLWSVREKSVHSLRMFDRTTRMLLAITLVFMFAYLPFISLELVKYAAPGVFASMSGVSLAAYHLFWRSYLINSCANPIIYCLYDLRFRRESLKIVFKFLPFKNKKCDGKQLS